MKKYILSILLIVQTLNLFSQAKQGDKDPCPELHNQYLKDVTEYKTSIQKLNNDKKKLNDDKTELTVKLNSAESKIKQIKDTVDYYKSNVNKFSKEKIDLSDNLIKISKEKTDLSENFKKISNEKNDLSIRLKKYEQAEIPIQNNKNITQSDLINMKCWGDAFDEKANGSDRLQVKDGEKLSNDFLLDSLGLNNNFTIEVRVRSLLPYYGFFGIIYNSKSDNDADNYFMIKKHLNDSAVISSGIGGLTAGVSTSYNTVIFRTKMDIDVTEFHTLKIKKVGESLTFYIDNIKLWETVETRIETKQVSEIAINHSDVLYDYIGVYTK